MPAVYVSADDLAGLGAELARRGITGRDAPDPPTTLNQHPDPPPRVAAGGRQGVTVR